VYIFGLDSFILIRRYTQNREHKFISTNFLNSDQVLHGHTRDVTAFELSDHILVSGSRDFMIEVWNLVSGQNIRTLAGHKHPITSLLFYTPGLLASSSEDGTIRFWDMKSGTCTSILNGHGTRSIWGVYHLKHGNFASYGADRVIRFWGSIKL